MWRQNIGVIVLALILGLSYGGHMLYRYLKIRADSAKRAAAVIRVIQDANDVSEIGYVYEM